MIPLIIAGIATAASVAGQMSAANAQTAAANQAGMAAQSQAALNAEMANIEAQDALVNARREADAIRRQALLMRAGIAVAQSGSGVMIGEGSAQAAMDQLDALAGADALAALYAGNQRAVSARTSGRFATQAGNERAKGFAQAANSTRRAAQYGIAATLANFASQAAMSGAFDPKTSSAPTGGSGFKPSPNTPYGTISSSGFKLGGM